MTSGNVYRRTGGEWQYRFDVGVDPLSGKRRRLTKSGFATKREAASAMREAIRAHEQGRSVVQTGRTVLEFMEEWLPAVRPNNPRPPRTRRSAPVLPGRAGTWGLRLPSGCC